MLTTPPEYPTAATGKRPTTTRAGSASALRRPSVSAVATCARVPIPTGMPSSFLGGAGVSSSTKPEPSSQLLSHSSTSVATAAVEKDPNQWAAAHASELCEEFITARRFINREYRKFLPEDDPLLQHLPLSPPSTLPLPTTSSSSSSPSSVSAGNVTHGFAAAAATASGGSLTSRPGSGRPGSSSQRPPPVPPTMLATSDTSTMIGGYGARPSSSRTTRVVEFRTEVPTSTPVVAPTTPPHHPPALSLPTTSSRPSSGPMKKPIPSPGRQSSTSSTSRSSVVIVEEPEEPVIASMYHVEPSVFPTGPQENILGTLITAALPSLHRFHSYSAWALHVLDSLETKLTTGEHDHDDDTHSKLQKKHHSSASSFSSSNVIAAGGGGDHDGRAERSRSSSGTIEEQFDAQDRLEYQENCHEVKRRTLSCAAVLLMDLLFGLSPTLNGSSSSATVLPSSTSGGEAASSGSAVVGEKTEQGPAAATAGGGGGGSGDTSHHVSVAISARILWQEVRRLFLTSMFADHPHQNQHHPPHDATTSHKKGQQVPLHEETQPPPSSWSGASTSTAPPSIVSATKEPPASQQQQQQVMTVDQLSQHAPNMIQPAKATQHGHHHHHHQHATTPQPSLFAIQHYADVLHHHASHSFLSSLYLSQRRYQVRLQNQLKHLSEIMVGVDRYWRLQRKKHAQTVFENCFTQWRQHTHEQVSRRNRWMNIFTKKSLREKCLKYSFIKWKREVDRNKTRMWRDAEGSWKRQVQQAEEELKVFKEIGREEQQRECQRLRLLLEEEQALRQKQFETMSSELNGKIAAMKLMTKQLEDIREERDGWKWLWMQWNVDRIFPGVSEFPPMSGVIWQDASSVEKTLKELVLLVNPPPPPVHNSGNMITGSSLPASPIFSSGVSAGGSLGSTGGLLSNTVRSSDPFLSASSVPPPPPPPAQSMLSVTAGGSTSAAEPPGPSSVLPPSSESLLQPFFMMPKALGLIKELQEHVEGLLIHWANSKLAECGSPLTVLLPKEDLRDGEVYAILLSSILAPPTAGGDTTDAASSSPTRGATNNNGASSTADGTSLRNNTNNTSSNMAGLRRSTTGGKFGGGPSSPSVSSRLLSHTAASASRILPTVRRGEFKGLESPAARVQRLLAEVLAHASAFPMVMPLLSFCPYVFLPTMEQNTTGGSTAAATNPTGAAPPGGGSPSTAPPGTTPPSAPAASANKVNMSSLQMLLPEEPSWHFWMLGTIMTLSVCMPLVKPLQGRGWSFEEDEGIKFGFREGTPTGTGGGSRPSSSGGAGGKKRRGSSFSGGGGGAGGGSATSNAFAPSFSNLLTVDGTLRRQGSVSSSSQGDGGTGGTMTVTTTRTVLDYPDCVPFGFMIRRPMPSPRDLLLMSAALTVKGKKKSQAMIAAPLLSNPVAFPGAAGGGVVPPTTSLSAITGAGTVATNATTTNNSNVKDFGASSLRRSRGEVSPANSMGNSTTTTNVPRQRAYSEDVGFNEDVQPRSPKGNGPSESTIPRLLHQKQQEQHQLRKCWFALVRMLNVAVVRFNCLEIDSSKGYAFRHDPFRGVPVPAGAGGGQGGDGAATTAAGGADPLNTTSNSNNATVNALLGVAGQLDESSRIPRPPAPATKGNGSGKPSALNPSKLGSFHRSSAGAAAAGLDATDLSVLDDVDDPLRMRPSKGRTMVEPSAAYMEDMLLNSPFVNTLTAAQLKKEREERRLNRQKLNASLRS